MGRIPMPSIRYLRAQEEHERVIKLIKNLEEKHLGKKRGFFGEKLNLL